jgi:hypothetical protein
MLTTPADVAFALCVKERVGWICEYCGKQYHPGDQGLQAAHYFSRGMWSTRFEPLNCFSLCYFDHQRFHGNPDAFHAWAEKKLGALYLDILREKAYNITLGKEIKQTKGKGEIAAHYRTEHEKQLSIRALGEVGRIDFQGWA